MWIALKLVSGFEKQLGYLYMGKCCKRIAQNCKNTWKCHLKAVFPIRNPIYLTLKKNPQQHNILELGINSESNDSKSTEKYREVESSGRMENDDIIRYKYQLFIHNKHPKNMSHV